MTTTHAFDLAELAMTFERMLDDDLPREAMMARSSHLFDAPRSSRAEPEMEIGIGTTRVRRLPTQEASQSH